MAALEYPDTGHPRYKSEGPIDSASALKVAFHVFLVRVPVQTRWSEPRSDSRT
jgi:hypothetical protein